MIVVQTQFPCSKCYNHKFTTLKNEGKHMIELKCVKCGKLKGVEMPNSGLKEVS
jgi:translation initiation factor 2 beta subunit (eIF-2beta)/eIF-5